MFLVTGGEEGLEYMDYLDSTETFDPLVGSWTASQAKLPRPMLGLRAENNLLFGNYYFLVLLFRLSLNTSPLTKS